MRYKKLKLSTILLLGLGLTAVQAQNMNVKAKSGTNTAYVINDIRKLTFSGGNLVLTKKVGSAPFYAISSIRYLNFSSGTSTSISDAQQVTSKLTVYPNPVHDKLYISLANSTSESVQIDVVSIHGKTVYSQAINAQALLNHTINVSSWQGGMYLVRINNGKETVTTKFLKN